MFKTTVQLNVLRINRIKLSIMGNASSLNKCRCSEEPLQNGGITECLLQLEEGTHMVCIGPPTKVPQLTTGSLLPLFSKFLS